MLEVSHGEWGLGRTPSFEPLAVKDLSELIARFAAAPPLSSRGEGAIGDHAWISVIDRGFILHAYFGEEVRSDGVINFELYGPRPPGKEREHADPHDGSGLAGSMTMACLEEVLLLLDQGRSPIDHVRRSARDVSVVADV